MLSAWFPCQKEVALAIAGSVPEELVSCQTGKIFMHSLRRKAPNSYISIFTETCNSPHVQKSRFGCRSVHCSSPALSSTPLQQNTKAYKVVLKIKQACQFFCWAERMCSPCLLKAFSTNQQVELHARMAFRANQLT